MLILVFGNAMKSFQVYTRMKQLEEDYQRKLNALQERERAAVTRLTNQKEVQYNSAKHIECNSTKNSIKNEFSINSYLLLCLDA